jgi:hypothetical protein
MSPAFLGRAVGVPDRVVPRRPKAAGPSRRHFAAAKEAHVNGAGIARIPEGVLVNFLHQHKAMPFPKAPGTGVGRVVRRGGQRLDLDELDVPTAKVAQHDIQKM